MSSFALAAVVEIEKRSVEIKANDRCIYDLIELPNPLNTSICVHRLLRVIKNALLNFRFGLDAEVRLSFASDRNTAQSGQR